MDSKISMITPSEHGRKEPALFQRTSVALPRRAAQRQAGGGGRVLTGAVVVDLKLELSLAVSPPARETGRVCARVSHALRRQIEDGGRKR